MSVHIAYTRRILSFPVRDQFKLTVVSAILQSL